MSRDPERFSLWAYLFLKSTLSWESRPKVYWSELLNSSENIKELKVKVHCISFLQLSNIQISLVVNLFDHLNLFVCMCVYKIGGLP